MKTKKIDFLGIPIDAITEKQTLDIIKQAIEKKKHILHTVVNAGKVVRMQRDRKLFESVVKADMINADGMAVVWASYFLGKPLPQRVNGTNLMNKIVKMAFKENYKIFFLGAKKETIEKVVKKYTQTYNKNIIAGYRDGYFQPEEEKKIAKDISKSGADILFVGISSPIKENFLYHNTKQLEKVSFTMGVGGSFDVVAGLVKRAPMWVQQMGLEWFFRLIQEPKRLWKRYLWGNSQFILLVFREKIYQIFKKK